MIFHGGQIWWKGWMLDKAQAHLGETHTEG